jgi:hypothetical protein
MAMNMAIGNATPREVIGNGLRMNSTVDIDQKVSKIQASKVNIYEVAKEYHPVTPFDFDIDKDFDTEQKEEDKLEEGKSLLGKWHVRLNHLPFKKIKLLAEQGRLQKRVIKAEIPFCPACTYRKATRKPWKGKGPSKPLKETEYTGQCISVDSLNQLQKDSPFKSREC